MSLSVNFREAELGSMFLSKVPHPNTGEQVLVSKKLCQVGEDDAELLAICFLKSFRSLELHQLTPSEDLSQNTLHTLATEIFADSGKLLENGGKLAQFLFEKSNHPNIKSGDLCVALIDKLVVDAGHVRGLSIIKSESKIPFLQINEEDGDLTMSTQQGIYPDKIDKGCLIVDHGAEEGYMVYLFDKSGNTQFWNRDFVGASPVQDDDYLTKRYSELCVAFAERGLSDDVEQEERMEVAKNALGYLEKEEQFEFGDFATAALGDPQRVEQFEEFKSEYESDKGHKLEESFTVSKEEAEKAKKKLKARLKLDVGVDLNFSSGFLHQADHFMERGFDDGKQMKFVKIYYYEES